MPPKRKSEETTEPGIAGHTDDDGSVGETAESCESHSNTKKKRKRKQTKGHACIHPLCKGYFAGPGSMTRIPTKKKFNAEFLRKLLVYLQVSDAVVDRILKECLEGRFVNYYACTNHFKEVRARPGAESFFHFYEGDEKYQSDPVYTMGAPNVHTDLYGKIILSILCSFL